MPGYYIGPALFHYRSHHVLATATSAPRITDTVLSPKISKTLLRCTTSLHLPLPLHLLAPPPSANDIVHDRRLTFPVSVQEQRVAAPLESVPEQRVVSTDAVQEQRMVLPPLAVSKPIHTTPIAPLPNADVLVPRTYPPPPGLSAHPDTDQPNYMLHHPDTDRLHQPSQRPHRAATFAPCHLRTQHLWLLCCNCPLAAIHDIGAWQ